MLHDRPTVEYFVVLGVPEGAESESYKGRQTGLRVYGTTETKEGADMLAEEAKRMNWTFVHAVKRRKSVY